MARSFDGSSQIMTGEGGLAGSGAISLAAIVRTGSALAVWNSVFMPDNSTTYRYILIANSGQPGLYYGGMSRLSSVTLGPNKWYFLAAVKAAGSARPRILVYDYATSTWTRGEGDVALGDVAITSGYAIGTDGTTGEMWRGDIAIVGGWRRVLADSEVEPLAFSFEPWRASSPRGLWLLDQRDVSTPVRDLSGYGADETSRTGTTVLAASVPIWNAGAAPVAVDLPLPRLLPSPPQPERIELQGGRVRIRHVTMQETESESAVSVLGKPFAGDWGINGELGWQRGSYNRRIGEEGEFTLELPNAPGSDGVLHRDRLLITRTGRARPLPGGLVEYSGGSYRPGDEWIEIYADGAPDNGLVYVGTPTKAIVTKQRITITGWDAMWLLKKTREFQAGFWHHAPRDVIEHYTNVWECAYADDMAATHPDRLSRSVTFSGGVATLTATPAVSAAIVGQPALALPADAVALRAEAVVNVPSGQIGALSLAKTPVGPLDYLGMFGLSIGTDSTVTYFTNNGSLSYDAPGYRVKPGTDVTLAIEARHGWAYFYVDGTLIGTAPTGDQAALVGLVPQVASMVLPSAITCRGILWRRCRPLLTRSTDRGDYRLPGTPTPGGLHGAYFDGSDEVAKVPPGSGGPDSLGYRLMVGPTKEPVVTRVDPTMNFPLSTPPSWRPAGMAGNNFGVRWTGAVWMNPAWGDVRFRLAADDAARVWIGKTTGPPLVSATFTGGSVISPYMSAHVGDGVDFPRGWYPIVIEYQQATAGGQMVLELNESHNLAGWYALWPEVLSPYGTFNEQVRNDSHYDALKSVADSFGYQLRLEPRSLESGQFPGLLTPRLRQGVDTALTLDEDQAWELNDAIDAENVADAIVADAAGIADPRGTAQLSAEIVNYEEASRHLLLATSYEGLAEISQPALVRQRLQSLLALSAAPWEEVAARSRGHRELIDRWPLPATGSSGERALFGWSPGDGLRLNLPSLGVVDESPRQIMGVSRDFNPEGMKPPVAAFRQRPRAFSDVLRRLKRQALLPRRNYQGGLTTLSGASGSTYSGVSIDATSRIFLPSEAQIVKAVAVVTVKSDATPWNLVIGGTNRISGITGDGTYDITPWVTTGQTYATLARTGTSTGNWVLQLIVTLRI